MWRWSPVGTLSARHLLSKNLLRGQIGRSLFITSHICLFNFDVQFNIRLDTFDLLVIQHAGALFRT